MRKLELLNISGVFEKGALKLSPAALPMLAGSFETGLPEAVLKHLADLRQNLQKEIVLPKNLKGTLRAYQEDGIRYLARMADCRLGCCLADDMGLGKTVQLLGLLLREASQGPSLVVCPASLCRNWEKEAARFTPSLRVKILPVNNREETI
jgi:SNF2 family DNA or RNA helicase